MVVLATHTRLTIVLPGPQPTATCVVMPSASAIGAGVKASADVATDKAKQVTAINLIMICSSLQCPHCRLWALAARSLEIDQDRFDELAGKVPTIEARGLTLLGWR